MRCSLFGLSGTCRACHHQIPPNEFVMKTPDGAAVYHVTCFACVTCHCRLVPGDRYGIVNGNLVCESDYVRAALTNHQRPQQPTSSATSSASQQRHKLHNVITHWNVYMYLTCRNQTHRATSAAHLCQPQGRVCLWTRQQSYSWLSILCHFFVRIIILFIFTPKIKEVHTQEI